MARREYVLHQLWGPMITSFNHKRVNYADQGVHDFDMKIIYEAVSYDTGLVSAGNPEGFGTSHYDTTPSPNLGAGGISNGGSFAGQGGTSALGTGILNNALNTVNNYQSAAGLVLGGAAVASAVGLGISLIGKAAGALSGFSFPGAAGTNTSNTQAGTSGTESANLGEDPSAEQDEDGPWNQPATAELDESGPWDNNANPELGEQTNSAENQGLDEAGPWDSRAPEGTDYNPSSSGDQDTQVWDF